MEAKGRWIGPLRADMPAIPAERLQQAEARIARKVCALFGIAGPEDALDAGGGYAWGSDYNRVTLNELIYGGPFRENVSSRKPEDTVEEFNYFLQERGVVLNAVTASKAVAPLANAMVNPYGPDTKAALVLTGVNTALRPVVQAMSEVLNELRGEAGLDDERVLLATAACLIQDAFASQPLLVLAGLQSARIQRASLLSSNVLFDEDRQADGPILRVGRTEYGFLRPVAEEQILRPDGRPRFVSSHKGVRDFQPRDLELVTEIVGDLIAPEGSITGGPLSLVPADVFQGDLDDHRDLANLRPDQYRRRAMSALISILESTILGGGDGPGQTEVLIRPNQEGRPTPDAFVPRLRQISSLLSAADSYFKWARASTGEQSVPLPIMNAQAWARRPIIVRRAAVLGYYLAHRMSTVDSVISTGTLSFHDQPQRTSELGSNEASVPPRIENAVLARKRLILREAPPLAERSDSAQALRRAAEVLLEGDDPLLFEVRVYAAARRCNGGDLATDWAPEEELEQALAALDWLLDAVAKGHMSPARYAELFVGNAPALSVAHKYFTYIDAPGAQVFEGRLTTHWNACEGILADSLFHDPRGGPRPVLDLEYLTFLQHYADFLTDSTAISERAKEVAKRLALGRRSSMTPGDRVSSVTLDADVTLIRSLATWARRMGSTQAVTAPNSDVEEAVNEAFKLLMDIYAQPITQRRLARASYAEQQLRLVIADVCLAALRSLENLDRQQRDSTISILELQVPFLRDLAQRSIQPFEGRETIATLQAQRLMQEIKSTYIRAPHSATDQDIASTAPGSLKPTQT